MPCAPTFLIQRLTDRKFLLATAGIETRTGSSLGKRKHPDADITIAHELAQRDGAQRQSSSSAGTGATPAGGPPQLLQPWTPMLSFLYAQQRYDKYW